MTLEDLDKQDRCKHLLEEPAPIVVGNLIVELRKHMALVAELKRRKRSVMDEDDIDTLLKEHGL
jgi:hypothetical protein